LVKIFFCPNAELEEEVIKQEREKGNFIIDRDLFDYFEEVGKCLGQNLPHWKHCNRRRNSTFANRRKKIDHNEKNSF